MSSSSDLELAIEDITGIPAQDDPPGTLYQVKWDLVSRPDTKGFTAMQGAASDGVATFRDKFKVVRVPLQCRLRFMVRRSVSGKQEDTAPKWTAVQVPQECLSQPEPFKTSAAIKLKRTHWILHISLLVTPTSAAGPEEYPAPSTPGFSAAESASEFEGFMPSPHRGLSRAPFTDLEVASSAGPTPPSTPPRTSPSSGSRWPRGNEKDALPLRADSPITKDSIVTADLFTQDELEQIVYALRDSNVDEHNFTSFYGTVTDGLKSPQDHDKVHTLFTDLDPEGRDFVDKWDALGQLCRLHSTALQQRMCFDFWNVSKDDRGLNETDLYLMLDELYAGFADTSQANWESTWREEVSGMHTELLRKYGTSQGSDSNKHAQAKEYIKFEGFQRLVQNAKYRWIVELSLRAMRREDDICVLPLCDLPVRGCPKWAISSCCARNPRKYRNQGCTIM